MKYKCDIKFMAVPSRMQNVVRQCSYFGLTFNDVAIDTAMSGLPLRTSQEAFSLPPEEGVTHRLVLQDDLIVNQHIKDGVQYLVNRFPENPIALYTYKAKKHLSKGIYKLHFCPGPAIVMPFSIMDKIKEEYHLYPNFPHDDWFYSWYCKNNGIKVLGVVPNLVTLDTKEESRLNHKVLKAYINNNYTLDELDMSSFADMTNIFGDGYINLSMKEFKNKLEECNR